MIERIRLPDAWAAIEHFFAQEWSDGLPVVPPTEALVAQMLTGTQRQARRRGRAGAAALCRGHGGERGRARGDGGLPAGLPARGPGRPGGHARRRPSGLHGVIATTHVSTPLVIVNGPVARDLDINGGYNLFGQGWRANATIGRALAHPRQPGWGPARWYRSVDPRPSRKVHVLHRRERGPEPLGAPPRGAGLSPADSAVTVLAAAAPFSMSDFFSKSALGIMRTFADSMSGMEAPTSTAGARAWW